MHEAWQGLEYSLSYHIFAAVTKIPKGLPKVGIYLFGHMVSDVDSIHFCLSYLG